MIETFAQLDELLLTLGASVESHDVVDLVASLTARVQAADAETDRPRGTTSWSLHDVSSMT